MKSKRAIHRLAKEFGYELRRQSKHLIWKHIHTGAVVTTAASPSDWRALRNIEKQFAHGALA
jgi:predicted RNA binding protein YcfA (HicA-like mRNA interferase family)